MVESPEEAIKVGTGTVEIRGEAQGFAGSAYVDILCSELSCELRVQGSIGLGLAGLRDADAEDVRNSLIIGVNIIASGGGLIGCSIG